MKKAKINNYCNGIQYLAGKIYTDKEVEHLDQNDFETIEDKFTDIIENKIISQPDKKVQVKTKKVK